jgi:hypothetical protein
MRNVRTKISRLGIGALLLAAAGLFLTACRKSDNNYPDIPAAALMAFNLAPDKGAIGIALSGNSISSVPLNYTAFTGQYINIYPGNRSIQAFNYNSNSDFTNSSYSFSPDKFYSLFVVGADTVYKNVVVEDNFDSLSASNGKAYVRFINAIPDSSQPMVKIAQGGTEVFNQPSPFTSVSGFAAVTPGAVSVSISNNGNVNANRTIDLTEKKAYTVLFLGKPGETNPDKAIQIRFIENGTLTDSTAAQ